MEETVEKPKENKGKKSKKNENEIEKKQFEVIGSHQFEALEKVSHVPHWIASSTPVSSNLSSDLSALDSIPDLSPEIHSKLQSLNISHWFPIQQEVIPLLLNQLKRPTILPPRDLCIAAPTGSGKTLCYVLPIIESLKSRLVSRISALVLLPSQDLAQQVYEVFTTFSGHANLKIVLLTGQGDLGNEKRLLSNQPDIIVATHGRLNDHLFSEDGIPFEKLRFLVIDEADRMLSDYRLDWLSQIDQSVRSMATRRLVNSSHPQKILLSATLSLEPELLQQCNLFQPRLFSVDDAQTPHATLPDALTQWVAVCAPTLKPLVLYNILTQNLWKRVLCFVGAKDASWKLSKLLQYLAKSNFVVELVTSDRFRGHRRKIIKRFDEGKIGVLICTDLVARGMDLSNVDAVINYSAPSQLRNYIHRAGRTARAGHSGTVLTLLTQDDKSQFDSMLENGGFSKDVLEDISPSNEVLESSKESYRNALRQMKDETKTKPGKSKKHGKMKKIRRKNK